MGNLNKVTYVDHQTIITASNLNGIQDSVIQNTSYTTCSTAANTSAKTVQLTDFVLTTGSCVRVKFTNTNTAVNPSLNVNSTGAKPIVKYGSTPIGASESESWTAGAVVELLYDGTSWVMITNSQNAIATLDEIEAYLGSQLVGTFRKSIYEGKTLSILGDSISTFAGYIPSGNATWYPNGTVTNVTDTWWYKVMDALGMTLNVNNSWSGSRVTTTNGSESAGCMTRCQNLGTNPDVIIVYMGINDFNTGVTLGTYAGKTAVPSTTTTFLEAYGIMLDKIMTAYPNSEIFVCTLPADERNGATGFPEINGNNVALGTFNEGIETLAHTFGAKLLRLDSCGIFYQNISIYEQDSLHPNKFGHSLMANYVIKEMDSLVRTRYAIS